MMELMSSNCALPIDLPQVAAEVAALIAQLRQQVQMQAREIALRDAKLEKVNFELARLKRWKFGAKTEAMNAQQRALFVPGTNTIAVECQNTSGGPGVDVGLWLQKAK